MSGRHAKRRSSGNPAKVPEAVEPSKRRAEPFVWDGASYLHRKRRDPICVLGEMRRLEGEPIWDGLREVFPVLGGDSPAAQELMKELTRHCNPYLWAAEQLAERGPGASLRVLP